MVRGDGFAMVAGLNVLAPQYLKLVLCILKGSAIATQLGWPICLGKPTEDQSVASGLAT